MKKLLLALLLSMAPLTVHAQVQHVIVDTFGSQATLPTTDASSVQQGSTTSGQAGTLVQGAVTTSAPAYTTGQTSPLSLTTSGVLRVNPSTATGASITAALSDGLGSGSVVQYSSGLSMLFNGATWDRAFTCPSTATISVTAASTTQIIALSGTTVIRVCSIAVSMSAAGTVQFLTGTGSNCGTPTNLSAAMTLPTGTPLAMSAPAGGAIFRSTAGGEFCIAAVTGNVTGFVTYAQY